MKDPIRRKVDKFERERAFVRDNAAELPAGSADGKADAV